MRRLRILLGDDHPMFSEGLKRILEPHFEISGIVEDGRELLSGIDRLHPDVVVVDISMPLLNGIEAAHRIRKMRHPPKIVFLTMHEAGTFAAAAFRAGASGYVLKRSAPAEIVNAIQEVVRGHKYVSPLIASDVLDTLMEKQHSPDKLQTELTSRQREVLQMIAEGKSLKTIATILNVSVRTVEFHKYRIMKVIGARTVAELGRYAVAHGIVQAS